MKTPAEIAQLFGVSKTVIKTWAYHFREYLSPSAHPAKGSLRLYTQEDIRVFALINDFWEEDPDLDHIQSLLNSRFHYEEKYIRLSYLNTPLLQNLEFDTEIGKGIFLLGGMKPSVEQVNWRIAEAYKLAGDELVNLAIQSDSAYELAYPIFFMYRHAIEVHLKLLVPSKDNTHNLMGLVNAFKSRYHTEFSTWAQDRITEFHELDPYSDAFRYGDSSASQPESEKVVYLRQLRVIVDHLCTGLKNKCLGTDLPPAYYT